MANQWTEEQKQVIWLRNRNILVSAAAGSGKTAVLVERILQKITDKEHPVDIDRLLIVTFTRAAAAEMRERIGTEIQKRLMEDPDNENLQRQETLLFHAQITTIDSFCQSVLRSYFHLIDLDPAFSIMDEGEAKLLRRDTAEELLEEQYAQASGEFELFVESFASGKNDENLIGMIWQVYEFSRSHPWPEEWLDKCKENYEINSAEELTKSAEYLLNSTLRLFHQMGQIFRDNAAPPSNPMGIRIDSKRRKKLMQKRLAMGHKQDDHEQAQGYEQSL